jgi:hypothetical protein
MPTPEARRRTIEQLMELLTYWPELQLSTPERQKALEVWLDTLKQPVQEWETRWRHGKASWQVPAHTPDPHRRPRRKERKRLRHAEP